jgi:hypothetical protein
MAGEMLLDSVYVFVGYRKREGQTAITFCNSHEINAEIFQTLPLLYPLPDSNYQE